MDIRIYIDYIATKFMLFTNLSLNMSLHVLYTYTVVSILKLFES